MNRHLKLVRRIGRVKCLCIVCSVFVAGLVILPGGPSLGTSLTLASGLRDDHGSVTAKAAASGNKFELRLDNAAPFSPLSLVLDDGTAENDFGWGNSYYNTSCAAIWLNRFSPSGLTYPLTLDMIRIPWLDQSLGSLNGRTFKLLVYTDADSDGDPSNAVLIHQSDQTIHVYQPNAMDSYTVNISVSSPGDLYIGWEDYWAESQPHPRLYPATVDTTVSHRRSYIAANSNSCSPNIRNLGVNQVLNLVDNISGLNPANLFVRAYGNDSILPTATPTAMPTVTATPIPRCPGERYSDVCPENYFYTAVTYLSNHGAISGYNDGTFLPYNNTTRAQLCKIVVLAKGWAFDTSSGPHFSDEPRGDVFYTFVETAYHHNIISGYSDGTFRPGDNVSRGQTCKIIVSAHGWGFDTGGGPHFTDVQPGDTFYAYIETAYNRHIISGYSDSTFQPGTEVTRGQLCKILYSALMVPVPTPTALPTSTATPNYDPYESRHAYKYHYGYGYESRHVHTHSYSHRYAYNHTYDYGYSNTYNHAYSYSFDYTYRNAKHHI